MHRSAPRVAKNTLAQLVARGLEGATNFTVTVLLARVLGASSLGAFALLTTYAGLFVFLGTFGLNLLMAREVARHREQARRYLANALGMGLVLAAITVALQIGIIRLVSDDPLVRKGVYLAAAFTVLQSCELLFVGVFYALERMELETICIFVEKAVLLVAVFALVLTGGGVMQVLGVFVGAAASVLLLYLALAARLVGFPRPAADFALWRRLAAESWPFSLNLLLTSIYFQTHVVLVALLASQRAAGYFRAGSVVALGLPIIAMGLNTALLPLMARAHPQRPQAFEFGLERAFRVLMLVGLPLAAGLIALAQPLMVGFYGPRFAPAILVFQLLGASVPIKFAANTVAAALTAADRQPQRTLAVGIGAAVCVALAFALIPRFHHNGAAVAAVMTDLVILATTYYYLRRAGYRLDMLSLAVRPAVAAAVMGVSLWWLRGMSLAVTVPAGIAIYAAAAVAMGAVRRADGEWLWQALASRQASLEVGPP
ncbi:MAG TPA: flippase [Armatimonadota bacterium]|nr:flippase [Armatimonadota bacterium]